MLKRILRISTLIILFWVIFIGVSWILARLYLPSMKTIVSGITMAPVADILIWLGILVVIGVILLFFRELFYSLFRYEVSRRQEGESE